MPAPDDAPQLTYRPDLHVVIGRWLNDYDPADHDFAGLRAEYDRVLAACRAHGTTRLLLDIRRRNDPTEAVTRWFSQQWLPEAVAAVAPARLRLAYLSSPQRFELLRTNSRIGGHLQEALACPTYDMELFDDEGAATRWLVG